MRLRYLHLQDDPPLQNITIPFVHETVLGRQCAIRFIVGVNGTGKSRLLRAITQAFLHLERGELPPFPITLIYDLHADSGERTICLHHPGRRSEATWQVFDPLLSPTPGVEWLEHLEQFSPRQPYSYTAADWPSGSSLAYLLPNVVLAYASGLTTEWDTLFAPTRSTVEVEAEDGLEEERPPHWNTSQEIKYQMQEGNQEFAQELSQGQQQFDPSSFGELENISQTGYFVSSNLLRLVTCAVTLHQALEDFRHTPTEAEEQQFRQRVAQVQQSQTLQSGLRGLLDELGWLWPVSVSFHLDPANVEQTRLPDWADILDGLRGIATAWRKEPTIPGQSETFFFDLRASIPKRPAKDTSTLAALIESFGNKKDKVKQITAFKIFQKLYLWQQAGFLQELNIALQMHGVDDLILYDWLSDGEQVFLGRMALFHLFQDEDDALILLDEPETHFNDVWKRRIVDIIDDSLRHKFNEVIISTHSSIALTDVFDTEITLLKDGNAVRPAIRTFGASPSEIMVYVFDAPDSMGQRAMEYLDSQLDRDWQVADIPELEHLIRNMGAGYHRQELRAIWRRLNASQDQSTPQ